VAVRLRECDNARNIGFVVLRACLGRFADRLIALWHVSCGNSCSDLPADVDAGYVGVAKRRVNILHRRGVPCEGSRAGVVPQVYDHG